MIVCCGPRPKISAAFAVLYAFHLIEHDGEDRRDRPFLDRKAALTRLTARYQGGHSAQRTRRRRWPTVFEHACGLGADGIVSKKVDGTYQSGPCPARVKVGNPASVAVQRECSEFEIDDPGFLAPWLKGCPRRISNWKYHAKAPSDFPAKRRCALAAPATGQACSPGQGRTPQ